MGQAIEHVCQGSLSRAIRPIDQVDPLKVLRLIARRVDVIPVTDPCNRLDGNNTLRLIICHGLPLCLIRLQRLRLLQFALYQA